MLKNQSIEELNNFLQLILQKKEKLKVENEDMIEKKEWKVFLKDFKQIAFDSGFLTFFLENGQSFLKIPNQEMRNEILARISELILEKLDGAATYKQLIKSILQEHFTEFFYQLDKIIFQNGKILNLKDRMEGVKDQESYEVFLHQACSIAIKEMLTYSKRKGIIDDFNFSNEQVPCKGKKQFQFKKKKKKNRKQIQI